MELLVTKFSNGKYENEDELFAENISADNVKLMGEMIALRSLRTLKQYDFHVADKLYIGLIKDFHHMGEVGYAISEGYDCAQIAICFLWQFAGKSVYDVCCVDLKGNKITVKLACYREVAMYIVKWQCILTDCAGKPTKRITSILLITRHCRWIP